MKDVEHVILPRSRITKLMEWLFGITAVAATWIYLLRESASPSSSLHSWNFEILWAPVVILFLFAVYVASVVLYRVYTFNDCPEAAEELNREIELARKDLKKKGFKFD